MPKFQVTTRELVYVDRTYEVEADDIDGAKHQAKGRNGEMVEEDIGETWDFVKVLDVEEV